MSMIERLQAMRTQLNADVVHARFNNPGSDSSYLMNQLLDILLSAPGSGAASKRFTVMMSQVGTSNPTVDANPFNEFGDIHVMACVRDSEGTFTLTVNDCIADATKVILHPYLPPFASGTECFVQVALTDEDTFTIKIYDAGGNLVDGFTKLIIDFEVIP
jgi:hypothetical protein